MNLSVIEACKFEELAYKAVPLPKKAYHFPEFLWKFIDFYHLSTAKMEMVPVAGMKVSILCNDGSRFEVSMDGKGEISYRAAWPKEEQKECGVQNDRI